MLSRILYAITSLLPVESSNVPDMPFIEQYDLFSIFGIQFYLRRFIEGRGHVPHGHTEKWALMLFLSGWYKECIYLKVEHGFKHDISRIRSIVRPHMVFENTYHTVQSCRRNTWVLVISPKKQSNIKQSKREPF